MMIKRHSLLLGSVIAFSSAFTFADNQLSTLSGIEQSPMTVEDMAEVKGLGHAAASNLGALLAARSDGVKSTPAWGPGGTLHPGTEDGAIYKANVADVAVP